MVDKKVGSLGDSNKAESAVKSITYADIKQQVAAIINSTGMITNDQFKVIEAEHTEKTEDKKPA